MHFCTQINILKGFFLYLVTQFDCRADTNRAHFYYINIVEKILLMNCNCKCNCTHCKHANTTPALHLGQLDSYTIKVKEVIDIPCQQDGYLSKCFISLLMTPCLKSCTLKTAIFLSAPRL